MDNETKVKELEMSFDITDEIISECILETEEETRAAIKEEIKRRFDRAKDDVERTAILLAKKRLDDMTFTELQELADLF